MTHACMWLVTWLALAGCADCPSGQRVMRFEQIGDDAPCPLGPLVVEVVEGQLGLLGEPGRASVVFRETDGGAACEHFQRGTIQIFGDGGSAIAELDLAGQITWNSDGEVLTELGACRYTFGDSGLDECCGDYRVTLTHR